MLQSINGHIEHIEGLRNSKVLILAASNLEQEILPTLFEELQKIGKVPRLDVIIHSRGGIVNAARRIALILRKFTEHLTFIVPYYCESSGTILTLSADEILAGDLAVFTPIDPHLHGGSSSEGTESSMSCLDIKSFGEMCQEWFNVDEQEAKQQSLSLLCNSIFPPTLTAFYRTTLELQKIGEELISYQLPHLSEQKRSEIIAHLMFSYHSHNYAITHEEMKEIGINIIHDAQVEQLAWQISLFIQKTIGGGLRKTVEDPWYDMLIGSSHSISVRKNQIDGFLPSWKLLE